MKARHRVVLASCSLLASIVIGCESHAQRAERLFEDPQPYPSYIVEVFPEPSAVDTLNPPDLVEPTNWLSVCVRFDKRPLVESSEDLESFNLQRSLHLDGQPINRDGYTLPMAGDYSSFSHQTLCWHVAMEPGLHVADISAQASDGEEFTYSWAFEVVP